MYTTANDPHYSLLCRAIAWVEAVQRHDLKNSRSKFKQLRICSDHFTRDMYNSSEHWKNSRLLKSAIPKLFKQDVVGFPSSEPTPSDPNDGIVMIDKSCQTVQLQVVDQMTDTNELSNTRHFNSTACQTPMWQNPDTLRRKLIRVQNRLRVQKLRSKTTQGELFD